MPLLAPITDMLDWFEFGKFSGTAGVIAALNKMPVLRPYAKLIMRGAGTTKPFVIDDIRDPETDKFMYLRDFEYSIMPGPQQLKVTLFDDNGHIRDVLTNIYNAIGSNEKPGAGGLTFIDFEFGWADFDDTFLGVIPTRKNISSSRHTLQISNVEISYQEGGISYQIVAFDTMTGMQGVMDKERIPQCDIREAITNILLRHGLAEPVFGNDEAESGPAECVRPWRPNGNDVLQIIKEWLFISGSKSVRGKVLYVWWDSIINKLHVADVPDPKALSINDLLAADLAGPHQVNYWDQNEMETGGGSIIIKFQPKISGIHQLKSVAQIGYLDGDMRKIAETLKSGEAGFQLDPSGKERAKGRGIAMHKPTTESNMPVSDQNLSLGLSDMVDAINRGIGVNTPGALNCLAEMECIGWPRADRVELYMFRLMKLNIRRPYGLNHYSDDENFGWLSRGYDDMLSGFWLIKNLRHVINDTGYRMFIELMRLYPEDVPPLSPMGSGGANP